MATLTSAAAFSATTNRLTAATYDNAGNLTAHPYIAPSGSISYDGNNLATQFTATGITGTYAYDAQGRRVRQTHNGKTIIYVYDAMGRLAVEHADQARAETGGVYYRTTDHLGSTRIVTDSAGAVKLRSDFFPFGEEIPADSSHGNRHQVLDGGIATYNAWTGIAQQFTGQQRDDTGLDYFWARNYFGASGRFLSVDPGNAGATLGLPQGWNAYGYVLNNPLRMVDPDGKDPCQTQEGIDAGNPCFSTEGTVAGPRHPTEILIFPVPNFRSYLDVRKFMQEQDEEPTGPDFLDGFQSLLDAIGVVFDPADALNCGIDICRGRFGDAAVRALQIAPGAGAAVLAGKVLGRTGRVGRVVGSGNFHLVDGARDRAGFKSKSEAILALRQFHRKVSRREFSLVYLDKFDPRKFIVPGFGDDAAVVYRVTQKGRLEPKTVLDMRGITGKPNRFSPMVLK